MQILSLPVPIFGFNFNDQLDLQGIVAGVNRVHTPSILMLSEKAIRFSGLTYLLNLFRAAQAESGVRLFLELDHGKDMGLIELCVQMEFDLIMVDFSDADFESNVLRTRKMVEMAHSAGIIVEGELGQIPNLEARTGVYKNYLTDPDLAAQFVERTNVDLLAASVGNWHGFDREKPDPDFDLIRELARRSKAPLVLHGGDFYSTTIIRRALQAGIGKVNLGPELRVVYVDALLRGLEEIDTYSADQRPVLEMARQAIEHLVLDRLSALSGSDS